MQELQVLLVAGTHGNEINPPWLFDQWSQQFDLINNHGLHIKKVLGNPDALKVCKRYIDRDLNRSFTKELLDDTSCKDHEVMRARELLHLHGPSGIDPSQVVVDLHTTTAAMGSSIVIYGRRSLDLALAGLLQARLGLPIYLHEGDDTQKGFLVECWPCGIVIEIGPVAQGLLSAKIVDKIKIIVEILFEELAKIKSGLVNLPKQFVVHRHLESIDFPRDMMGRCDAILHPSLLDKNWFPLLFGQYLFVKSDGKSINFEGEGNPIPVFINEAAYAEKNIAMSLTQKEIIVFSRDWQVDLRHLCLFNS